jgi:hypothetical protein
MTYLNMASSLKIRQNCIFLAIFSTGTEFYQFSFTHGPKGRSSIPGRVRSGGLGSIPGTTRKKKLVGLERGPLSLVSTTEVLVRKVAAPV